MDSLFETALESMWAASADAVVVVDGAGRIVRVNPAVRAMLGWESEELVGEPVESLVPEERRKVHRERREGFLAQPYARRMGNASVLFAMGRGGRQVPVDISLTPFKHGEERYTLAILRDAWERYAYEEELRRLSFRDGLTGLYNRAFLDEEFKRLERGRQRPVGVLVADVDGLKGVNDTRGHVAGDDLLKCVAATLESVLRVEDVLARSGGDEFVALLPGVCDRSSSVVMRRARKALDEARSRDLPVEVSLGIAVGEPGVLLEDVLLEADSRMYASKRERKGRFAPDLITDVLVGE